MSIHFTSMPASALHREVFLPAEIASAAGVEEHIVREALGGRMYVGLAEAVVVARSLRSAGAHLVIEEAGMPPGEPLAGAADRTAASTPRLPLVLSTALHALVITAAVLATSGGRALPALAATPDAPTATHLVFLNVPGPGGGGGGGGRQALKPATRAERVGRARVSSPVPEPQPAPPVEPEPVEPPPLEAEVLPTVVAPVVPAASDTFEKPGTIDAAPAPAASEGPGVLGGSGTGAGRGSGSGTGAGIGDGQGGGTGGGPYRPGSGITPPRLLREVKATYTEEARRSGLSGDVLLEIVVQRDGTVGDVTVRRGLAGGLNERAVEAVRQWRFAPATRQGVPVDVLVEVAVEFTLR